MTDDGWQPEDFRDMEEENREAYMTYALVKIANTLDEYLGGDRE